MPSAINFKGDLSHDSPSLQARLQRLLAPSALPAFAEAYRHCFASGGVGEVFAVRDPQASFNPRPARICQIILSDSDERRPEVLAAGLLISSSVPCNHPDLMAAESIAAQARSFIPTSTGELSNEGAIVVLAWALDALRHLHLGDASDAGAIHLIEKAKGWALSFQDRSELHRLCILVVAAQERLQRILDALRS